MTHIVCLRLTTEELALLDALTCDANFSNRTETVRHALLHAAELVPVLAQEINAAVASRREHPHRVSAAATRYASRKVQSLQSPPA